MALIFALTGGAFAATGHTAGLSKAIPPRPAPALLWPDHARRKSKPKPKAGARGPAGPAGKQRRARKQPAPREPQARPAPPAASVPPGTGHRSRRATVGADRPPGPRGKKGATGATGPQGAIHPGETLPAGASETGTWSTIYAAAESRGPDVIGEKNSIPRPTAPTPRLHPRGSRTEYPPVASGISRKTRSSTRKPLRRFGRHSTLRERTRARSDC